MLDGCSVHDSDKLEKVQLCADRIVTGLPIINISRDVLYSEKGWKPFKLDATWLCSKLTWGLLSQSNRKKNCYCSSISCFFMLWIYPVLSPSVFIELFLPRMESYVFSFGIG